MHSFARLALAASTIQLCGGVPLAGSSGCDAQDHSYDYLLLVQQWPQDFGQSSADYFTLHGMWPSRNGATDVESYPCACTNEAFDQTQLKPVLSEAQKYWPSLMGPNPSFWAHEWTKHGTCTGLTQLQYFNMTLTARAQLASYSALTKANMKVGMVYSAAQIDKAFKAAVGTTALLGCDNKNALKEIGFCLNKQDLVNDQKVTVDACAAPTRSSGGEVTSCDRTKQITWPSGSAPPAPSPGPPGPPGNATTCVPDKHGPPCKADADCVAVANCVRCAHSGYCTEVPAAAH